MFALDATAGPARPIDDRRASAIIAGALGGAGFPSPASGGGTSGAAPGGKALAVKLAIVTGGLATIAAVAWFALREPPRAAAPAPVVVAAPPPVEPPPPVVAAAPPPAPVESPPTVEEPTDEVTDPPTDEPSDPTPKKPRAHAKPRAATTPAQLDDLLAKANAQRAAHAWKAADALYARVSASSPAGLAGQTALVASAQLHLEHLNDPAGAERRFRAVLAHPGGLAEDARWGVAECERARGDTAGEKRALDDFLAHHASSPIAPRARARLAELSP